MTGMRKKYDAAFKRETVEFADHSEKSDRIIEQDLGLYQGAIRLWRNASSRESSKAQFSPKLSADTEIRRLRRELKDVRDERDILKKAMAIFTNDR